VAAEPASIVYLTAVLEYLCAELCELTGNEQTKGGRCDCSHLKAAVEGDEELNDAFVLRFKCELSGGHEDDDKDKDEDKEETGTADQEEGIRHDGDVEKLFAELKELCPSYAEDVRGCYDDGKWIAAEHFEGVYSDLHIYRADARYAGKPNAEKEWTSFLAIFLGFFGDSEYGRQLRAVVDEYDDSAPDWEEIGRNRATGGSLFGN